MKIKLQMHVYSVHKQTYLDFTNYLLYFYIREAPEFQESMVFLDRRER